MNQATEPQREHQVLQAIDQESACLQALIEAGYALDEAARWIETWAGDDAQALWQSAQEKRGTSG